MNMNKILEQAKKMQEEMVKAEQKIKDTIFKVEKQGVIVEANGNREITSLEINEILVDPSDKETLQDLIIIAINEVLQKIENEYKKNSPKAPSGFGF
ncbi:MAG: YbaB/EbfC family nucleoid-associated protein [Metamycoplasmataceae bacterium]